MGTVQLVSRTWLKPWPCRSPSVLSWIVVAGVSVTTVLAQSTDVAPRALDDGRQWIDLREAGTSMPPLERAAILTAFGDSVMAERVLRSVIRARPRSETADQAYELLSRLFLRSGRYSSAFRNLSDWERAFPDSAAHREERADLDVFRGLPDQRNGPRRPSTLSHTAGDDFSVPLSVNGKAARYLLDTGAWASVITAGEARRLGLAVRSGGGRVGDASGRGVQVRTAVASEVVVGAMRFREVSFLVLDSDEPAGILGMPVILATGHVRWSANGNWELGGPSAAESGDRNLVFYENKLLLATSVLDTRVFSTFDTGATSTDLNGTFPRQFPSAMPKDVKTTIQPIEGLGGVASVEALTLSEVIFQIGRTQVSLSPAQVTLQQNAAIGGECCIGNIGRDVLTKTGKFDLDLSTMILRLE